MKFIELFAGIGGFRYGLERTGGFECAYANDFDKYASAIYRYHWNDGTMHEADIRTVDASAIPNTDLLVGGFPCQSFSIAGKRGGFEDTRGTLFFEIARIARVKRPKYLWLENVKGLLSHDEGNTFATIITAIDELGYDCQWQVLNSKNHGVPQNRERVFIIGNLRGTGRPKVFPFSEPGETSSGNEQGNYSGTVKEGFGKIQNDATYIVACLDANYHKGIGKQYRECVIEETKPVMIHTAFQGETREYQEFSPTISTPSGGGHLPMVIGGLQSHQSPRTDGIIPCLSEAMGEGGGQIPMVAQSLQTDGQLRSGTSWDTNKPQSARNIRRLTPIECERLQGFPDNWTKHGIDKNNKQILISDSQRYKCCGNAVTTNVITDIGERLNADLP